MMVYRLPQIKLFRLFAPAVYLCFHPRNETHAEMLCAQKHTVFLFDRWWLLRRNYVFWSWETLVLVNSFIFWTIDIISKSSYPCSGVGKTSLAHLICPGDELKRPRSTVGCTIHVKVVQNVTRKQFKFHEIQNLIMLLTVPRISSMPREIDFCWILGRYLCLSCVHVTACICF